MRVIVQRFIAMRLVILCPVLSGSEKIQGKLCRMIARLSCGPLIATSLNDISALQATELETIPRTVQLELTVSLHYVISSYCAMYVSKLYILMLEEMQSSKVYF